MPHDNEFNYGNIDVMKNKIAIAFQQKLNFEMKLNIYCTIIDVDDDGNEKFNAKM